MKRSLIKFFKGKEVVSTNMALRSGLFRKQRIGKVVGLDKTNTYIRVKIDNTKYIGTYYHGFWEPVKKEKLFEESL